MAKKFVEVAPIAVAHPEGATENPLKDVFRIAMDSLDEEQRRALHKDYMRWRKKTELKCGSPMRAAFDLAMLQMRPEQVATFHRDYCEWIHLLSAAENVLRKEWRKKVN